MTLLLFVSIIFIADIKKVDENLLGLFTLAFGFVLFFYKKFTLQQKA